MRKRSILSFVLLIGLGICIIALSEQAPPEEKSFFESSLHFTSRGMGYWYSKEQGGLEQVTGIPYANLACKNCHISNCDTCHKIVENGKAVFSTKAANNQETCLKCHGRESLIITMIDKENNTLDVHIQKGMKCMDCHSAREIHGNGTQYNSMKQEGAMSTKCQNCHKRISSSLSHVAHGDRLDCSACHIRHVATCYNCHIDTYVKEGKRVSMPLRNWIFLMNYNGKVTSANMQTFVYQDKTFLIFAPMYSHSIMKEGRKCTDCHATAVIKSMKKDKFVAVTYENGEIKNWPGVIPVVEGKRWNLVYFNFVNGQWILISNPTPPLIQYAAYGTPLTLEQFSKLEKPQVSKNP